MTDTRCANPAYQVDVDVMMLEYTLHNAIQAHIHEHASTKRGASPINPQTKDTLLQIYDTLLHSFKQQHQDHTFTEGTRFAISILEFLVLFTQRKTRTTLSLDTVKEAQIRGLADRQQRYEIYSTLMGVKLAVEFKISQDWSGFIGKRNTTPQEPRILLADLLPRFMALSAQMAAVQGEINMKWIALASEFLTQASIEACVWASEDVVEALLGTFAWGRFNERALSDERESIINDMFLEGDNTPSETRGINKEWTAARLAALSLFAPGFRENEQEKSRTARLVQLKRQHPSKPFERDLIAYIDSLFETGQLLHSAPVLVQLEQGRLDGLEDDEEFAAFLERVGLGGHDRRVARIKLPHEVP